MVLGTAASAQDFRARADDGDRMMTTAVGDAYLDAIAPVLQQAMQGCLQDGARMVVGEPVTLVARVGRDGALSAVEVEPMSTASDCLARRLHADALPAPEPWDWERGMFPLTLRIGAGRGTVDGVRVGD